MKKLLLPIVVAFAMVSCQNTNEPQGFNEPQEIQLSAGVMQMTGDTKAFIADTNFANGTEIGIYGLKDGLTDWATPYFDNTGAAITDGGVVFTDKVYYPQDNKAVIFYAFYPKGTPTANASDAPTVAYDLTKQDDILWAQVKTGTLSNQTPNALSFAHKLSKVNFKVKAGADFAVGTKVTAIVVTGTNTSATLDVEAGTLAFATPGTISAFAGDEAITSTATATAFGDVMIQPDVEYTINVTAGGVDYTTKLTAPKAGDAKTVTLTFLPTGVDVTTSITAWNPATDEDVDIQK